MRSGRALVDEGVGGGHFLDGKGVGEQRDQVELGQEPVGQGLSPICRPEWPEIRIDPSNLGGDDPRSIVVKLAGEADRLEGLSVP
jgi:hypothetical protein